MPTEFEFEKWGKPRSLGWRKEEEEEEEEEEEWENGVFFLPSLLHELKRGSEGRGVGLQ